MSIVKLKGFASTRTVSAVRIRRPLDVFQNIVGRLLGRNTGREIETKQPGSSDSILLPWADLSADSAALSRSAAV